ncbi:MAG: CapA family protein, partial [Firmicutes bacterium]|nr:CapA family protein [Bacillota bacterium]
FMHTGTFTSSDEKRFVLVDVDGIKVGFVAYSTLYNGRDQNYTPAGQEILLNRYSAEKVALDVAAMKEAGVEYIIAYIHWGIEYDTTVNDVQVATAQEMADAGVDCIVGSHPHVVQPYSTVLASDGRTVPVFYSLGNFVSQMYRHDESRDSPIIRLRLRRNSAGKVYLAGKCYIPCRGVKRYLGRNYVVVPLTKKRISTSLISVELSRSSKRIKQILGSGIGTLNSYK